MSAEAPGASASGLRGGLGRLVASLVGLAHTRFELAALELGEERERLLGRLVLALIAVVGFSGTLLAVTALVVIAFWDTHRIAAIVGVAIFYLLVGCWAAWRLMSAPPAPPFAATLQTLEKDRDWVVDRLGGEK